MKSIIEEQKLFVENNIINSVTRTTNSMRYLNKARDNYKNNFIIL
jgi:hypothetical protein